MEQSLLARRAPLPQPPAVLRQRSLAIRGVEWSSDRVVMVQVAKERCVYMCLYASRWPNARTFFRGRMGWEEWRKAL
jgi:hypothetical protein